MEMLSIFEEFDDLQSTEDPTFRKWYQAKSNPVLGTEVRVRGAQR